MAAMPAQQWAGPALGASHSVIGMPVHSAALQPRTARARSQRCSCSARCSPQCGAGKQQQVPVAQQVMPALLPQQQAQQPLQHRQSGALLGAVAAAAAAASAGLALPGAAHAAGLALRAEPANALSLPTWAIHVSSVTEWVAAMALMWRYGEVSGNARWKGMTWGMMPALGSAMAACTWHFFYNSPDLDFLVALQAFLTVVGNFTCWLAAYRIYAAAQEQQPSA